MGKLHSGNREILYQRQVVHASVRAFRPAKWGVTTSSPHCHLCLHLSSITSPRNERSISPWGNSHSFDPPWLTCNTCLPSNICSPSIPPFLPRISLLKKLLTTFNFFVSFHHFQSSLFVLPFIFWLSVKCSSAPYNIINWPCVSKAQNEPISTTKEVVITRKEGWGLSLDSPF